MQRKRPTALIAFFTASLAVSSPTFAEDRRFSEYENLNEAILAARATLDLFWQVVSLEPCGCSGVVVAIKLRWEDQVVDVDVTDVRRIGPGQAEGKVEHTDTMEITELADVVVQFTDDDVIDWGFGRDGEWHGFFLFQAIQAGANVIPARDLEAKARAKYKAVKLP